MILRFSILGTSKQAVSVPSYKEPEAAAQIEPTGESRQFFCYSGNTPVISISVETGWVCGACVIFRA